MQTEDHALARLEELRGELRAERISHGELAELQSLSAYIAPGDVELLEPAGIPEGPYASGSLRFNEDGSPVIDVVTCGTCGRSWNDAVSSSVTPAPSGRCPFEYEHEHDEPVAPDVKDEARRVALLALARADRELVENMAENLEGVANRLDAETALMRLDRERG